MIRLSPRLPSSWSMRLLTLGIELTAALYVLPRIFGAGSDAVPIWLAQNTGLVTDVGAGERIGAGIDQIGPFAVALIVFACVLFVALRAISWATQEIREFMPHPEDQTLGFDRFSLKRKVLVALRPHAMGRADHLALRGAVKEQLIGAGVCEDDASESVNAVPISSEPLTGPRGGARMDSFLREAADKAFGTSFIAKMPESAPASLWSSFRDVLRARGYTFLLSGSLMPFVQLPVSPSGTDTVSTYTVHQRSSLPQSFVIAGRHRNARQEGLLLETLLAACQMYSAGVSGDYVSEAKRKFEEVTLRMASIGFVPPEDFDSPGHRGISSAEEIQEWSIDQVAAVLSPFREPIDIVEVSR